MIKVLVVDDSAFMRKALNLMLESDKDIKVVATANNGKKGVEYAQLYKPDVITMDVEMPQMNGLEALREIMKKTPTPVIMVSSLTTEGANVTLDAMSAGAVDFIAKSLSFVAMDITKIQEELIAKVKSVAKTPIRRRFQFTKSTRSSAPSTASTSGATVFAKRPTRLGTSASKELAASSSLRNVRIRLLAIGVSTGGPPVVEYILNNLPENFAAGIIIAQHMPATFTKSFANRLNNNSRLKIKEAAAGDVVRPSTVLIGKGGKHLTLRKRGMDVVVDLPSIPQNLYYPSADVMISSAVQIYRNQMLGLILTGMGRDGKLGIKDLYAAGGKAIAQNEESCVVYGMPKAIVDDKMAEMVLPIEDIPAVLTKIINK